MVHARVHGKAERAAAFLERRIDVAEIAVGKALAIGEEQAHFLTRRIDFANGVAVALIGILTTRRRRCGTATKPEN